MQPSISNSITKAIIPVAGYGTRRLPITKAIEKCMLPIGNRPIVDYIVEDCIKAGITEFFFVISGENTQIEAYYASNPTLKSYLQQAGKSDLAWYADAPEGVKINFVRQEVSGGKYGTAVPVGLVAPMMAPGESAVVLMGDDFIYNRDGSSEVGRLLAATPAGGNAMLGVDVPRDQLSRYGVIELDGDSNFVRIVEKPAPEQAPSTLINVSKYVLNYDLIQAVAAYAQLELSGEYHITEPINQYILGGGSMQVVPAQGRYLDGGTMEGWLYANNYVAGWVD